MSEPIHQGHISGQGFGFYSKDFAITVTKMFDGSTLLLELRGRPLTICKEVIVNRPVRSVAEAKKIIAECWVSQ